MREACAAVGLVLLLSGPAAAALRVVASTPDLADLARRVGGGRVKVESLAKGTEDIHAIPMRPSFVPKLHRADALVVLGFDAEHAFLPGLLEVAHNPRILPGGPGWIDCGEDVSPMNVPSSLSRAEGELHPRGNPHYNLDPRKAPLMAAAIARGLARVDAAGADEYRRNAEAFKQELTPRLEKWRETLAPLKGLKAVSHHRDMVYLADFAGLELVGEVEPKPGIAPTPRHLEALASRMKEAGARIVIREVHFPAKEAAWLAERTGAKVAVLAVMGGAFPGTTGWFAFMDKNLAALAEAAR